MKNQSGLTIISLLIYIIVLTVVIGTLATVQKYFYRNIDETQISSQTSEEHARFVTYLTDDINSGKIEDVEVSSDYTRLFLNDYSAIEYRVQNNTIYKIVILNKKVDKIIPLCKNIQTSNFTFNEGVLTTTLNINGSIKTNTFKI